MCWTCPSVFCSSSCTSPMMLCKLIVPFPSLEAREVKLPTVLHKKVWKWWLVLLTSNKPYNYSRFVLHSVCQEIHDGKERPWWWCRGPCVSWLRLRLLQLTYKLTCILEYFPPVGALLFRQTFSHLKRTNKTYWQAVSFGINTYIHWPYVQLPSKRFPSL